MNYVIYFSLTKIMQVSFFSAHKTKKQKSEMLHIVVSLICLHMITNLHVLFPKKEQHHNITTAHHRTATEVL